MPVAVADHGNAYMLAVLVANSSTFRSVVSKATVIKALTKIYYPWHDESGDNPELPSRAVIVDDSDFGDENHRKVATGVWKISGSYRLNFDFNIPATERTGRANEFAWFHKQTNNIMKEMRSIAGWGNSGVTSGDGNPLAHFNMMNYQRQEGPWEIDPSEDMLPDPQTGELLPFWHMGYDISYW